MVESTCKTCVFHVQLHHQTVVCGPHDQRTVLEGLTQTQEPMCAMHSPHWPDTDGSNACPFWTEPSARNHRLLHHVLVSQHQDPPHDTICIDIARARVRWLSGSPTASAHERLMLHNPRLLEQAEAVVRDLLDQQHLQFCALLDRIHTKIQLLNPPQDPEPPKLHWWERPRK